MLYLISTSPQLIQATTIVRPINSDGRGKVVLELPSLEFRRTNSPELRLLSLREHLPRSGDLLEQFCALGIRVLGSHKGVRILAFIKRDKKAKLELLWYLRQRLYSISKGDKKLFLICWCLNYLNQVKALDYGKHGQRKATPHPRPNTWKCLCVHHSFQHGGSKIKL